MCVCVSVNKFLMDDLDTKLGDIDKHHAYPRHGKTLKLFCQKSAFSGG